MIPKLSPRTMEICTNVYYCMFIYLIQLPMTQPPRNMRTPHVVSPSPELKRAIAFSYSAGKNIPAMS